MDFPRFWTHLQFASPLFTEVMLQRSGAAPLTVKVPDEISARYFESVLSLALSQLDRLRAVEFSRSFHPSSHTRWHPMPGFTSITQWRGCAPVLESLVLDHNCSRVMNERLPPDWMRGKAPMLRVLCIRSCGVTWESAPLGSQLTHLTLQEKRRGDAHRTSAEGFIGSLFEMQLLHELCLEGFAPRVPAAPHAIPDLIVTMPSLTKLEVNDSPKHASLLFRLLRTPCLEVVKIEFSSGDAEPAVNMGHTYSHFKQAIGKDSTIHDGVRHLHIDGHSGDEPRFDLWFHPDDPQQDAWYCSRRFTVKVTFSANSILPTLDLLTILDAHLDLSTVLTLYVTMHPSPLWSRGVWTLLSRNP